MYDKITGVVLAITVSVSAISAPHYQKRGLKCQPGGDDITCPKFQTHEEAKAEHKVAMKVKPFRNSQVLTGKEFDRLVEEVKEDDVGAYVAFKTAMTKRKYPGAKRFYFEIPTHVFYNYTTTEEDIKAIRANPPKTQINDKGEVVPFTTEDLEKALARKSVLIDEIRLPVSKKKTIGIKYQSHSFSYGPHNSIGIVVWNDTIDGQQVRFKIWMREDGSTQLMTQFEYAGDLYNLRIAEDTDYHQLVVTNAKKHRAFTKGPNNSGEAQVYRRVAGTAKLADFTQEQQQRYKIAKKARKNDPLKSLSGKMRKLQPRGGIN
jgi:hypothetical protein